MKTRVKPKYQAGAAVNYITRRQALKKLQLSLKDFRRLCILKGIYPHDPLHKKKVNKGSTESHVYYYRKDINFLAHEPIIDKFRENKIFLRKLNHWKAKREESKLKKLYENKPVYTLDRIVKERYPTFGSALRDLDDALCLTFVFSTLPHTNILKQSLIEECRKVSAEFMHYIIDSQSLRNVFVSIKGIYYQAEVCGEKITWIVPHDRGHPHVTDVDFSVMVTFAEFYVAMLGFVNYRLYQTAGLYYPPQIETGQNVVEGGTNDEDYTEKVYSLGKPLAKRTDAAENDDEMIDDFGDDDGSLAERIKEIKDIKSLFKGCVFFLNREVPKEALTFVIRSCGGTVGWQGGPMNMEEQHSNITHQVVDRQLNKLNVNRRYVQPQWVFDCLNARRKLPAEKYMPGVALPPHFSPFAKENVGDYVPVERLEELRALGKDTRQFVTAEKDETAPEEEPKKAKKVHANKEEKPEMSVKLGRMHKKNRQVELNEKGAEMKMREMMIPHKHKRVYHSIKTGLKRNRNEAMKLKSKRQKINATKQA